MQIQECLALKPGLFENKRMKFENRINIIIGKNASGKSLLAKAIIDTLCGRFSERLLLNVEVWENLNIDILLFTASNKFRFSKKGNKSFLIKSILGSVEKDLFPDDLVKIEGKDWAKDKFWKLKSVTTNRKLFNQLSKFNIETFLNISFLASPIEISREGSLNYDNLKGILLEDNTNFYSLYNSIRDAFSRGEVNNLFNNLLLNEILKREGMYKNIEKKIKIIDIQDSKNKKLHMERGLVEEKIDDINKELNKIRGQKSLLQGVLKSSKRFEELNNRIKKIEEEICSEEEKIQNVSNMEREIREQFFQFKDFCDENKENLQRMQENYRELMNITALITDCIFIKKVKKGKIKKAQFIIIFSSIILLILFHFFNKNFFLFIPVNIRLYFFAGISLFSLLSLISLNLYYLFISRNKYLNDLIKRSDQKEEDLRSILKQNNIYIDGDIKDIYEFLLQYFEDYGEYTVRKHDLDEMKRFQRGSTYLNDIKNELAQFQGEKEYVKLEMERELKLAGIEDDLYLSTTKINNKIFDLNSRIKSLKKEIMRNKNIMSHILMDLGKNHNHYKERIGLIKEKEKGGKILDALNDHKETMNFILGIMHQANERRENGQLTKLVKLTREKFNLLTNNKYLMLIDDDQILKLITQNKFNENMEQSIIHMILLSVKIAATDFLIDMGIAFPLIIDEPFLYLDDMRVERLKKMIDDISNKRQVIIFTHCSNYKYWGNVIEL